jgi:hypothetical protein
VIMERMVIMVGLPRYRSLVPGTTGRCAHRLG